MGHKPERKRYGDKAMPQTLANLEAEALLDMPELAKHPRRVRMRVLRACVITWPTKSIWKMEDWHRDAIAFLKADKTVKVCESDAETADAEDEQQERKGEVGFAIMTIIAAAVLSFLVQKFCAWAWEKWQQSHNKPALQKLVESAIAT
jgi:hypothetical protein